MDTHRLKYFLRIAEEGSMTRAATVLGIAQPALSRQVRLLEADLGVVLFRRSSRGVELTEEGERLRASTAGPLRQLELALQYAGSPLARLERGLRLGIPSSAVDVLAAPMMAGLAAAFAGVDFEVAVADTDRLVEGMLNGVVDVAIVNPVRDDRVFYRDLAVEDLVVVGGPGSGLDPERAVGFAEFAALPLVLPSSHTGIGNTVANAALRLRVRLRSRFATDSVQVAKRLIETADVYAALPLSSCRADIDSGRLRYAPLCDPLLTQVLGVAATSKIDLPSDFVAQIGEVIRQVTAVLITSGAWQARLRSPHPWDPNLPYPQ